MKFCLFLIFLYVTSVVSKKDYPDPNDKDNKLGLLKGLDTESNGIVLETDNISENLTDLNKRLDAYKYDTSPASNQSQAWTTILRRQDGSVDFYRNWAEYLKGFGNPPNGEFFVGLEKLHELTLDGPTELMVVLKDWNNEMRYAQYDEFQIGGQDDKYVIRVLGIYSGDAGDSLRYHKDMAFSTFDHDNDASGGNCALSWQGAWWFRKCYHSHLNGPYRKEQEANKEGVDWIDWKSNYSLKFAEMKIRRR